MAEVETKVDFIQWLGRDLSAKVFTHLDDPGDLVRVSAVSSSWYRFAYIDEFPINLTKAVRIRMGHSRYPKLVDMPIGGMCFESDVVENGFIWTYTSPVFSMSHENQWHEYKLAEPVLCIGGILQMEECGRFGIPGVNVSFFGRFSEVQLVGWSLSPLIDVKMQHPSGKCTLKYCPKQIVVTNIHHCRHHEEIQQYFMPAVTYLNE